MVGQIGDLFLGRRVETRGIIVAQPDVGEIGTAAISIGEVNKAIVRT
jgi:hypothetical protein